MSEDGQRDGEHRRETTAWSEPTALPAEEALRLLALLNHPVRSRILRTMVHGEPMRVSDVARAVGEPANSVSYHMRALEKAGIAQRHVPAEGADGRETWWVIPDWRGLSFDPASIRDLPGGQAAVAQFEQAEATQILELFSVARMEAAEALGLPGLRADGPLRLTRQEAQAFQEGVTELIGQAIEASKRHSRAGDDGEPSYVYDYRVALLAAVDQPDAS
nr:helix-turn-helix domain-containing protein [Actinomyces sp.]